MRNLSLRTWLLGPLALQMVLMTLVILLVGYQNGQRELTRVATSSQQRASRQVREYLQRFLKTPQQVIQLMNEEIGRGHVDPADRTAVTRLLWMLHRTFPEAAYLNYGWSNGDFIGLGQVDNNSSQPFLEEAPAATISHLKQIRLDGSGRPGGLQRIKPYADFRSDGWYSTPIKAGRLVWTPIYNWVDAPEVMALGAGMPVRYRGRIIGVAGIDTFLANIGRFLRNLPVAETGVVYIVDHEGLLVADSSSQLPFTIINGRGVRHQAERAKDPLIRASARALIQSKGSFSAMHQSQQLELPLTDGNAFVRVDPFRDDQGLDWRIVVVIPEADLYGDLQTETTLQVGVALGSILLSGLLTVLVVNFVTRQLNQLVIKSTAMAEGDLSRAVEPGAIQEINRLANSFNDMAERLRRSIATLRLRNREIARLAEVRGEQLATQEQQLHQEVRQRQQLEQSLAQAAHPKPITHLADPVTGLLSQEGLERRLRDSKRDPHLPTPAVAIQLKLAEATGAPPDMELLARIARWMEEQVAAHHGLAAHDGAGRFSALFLGVKRQQLDALLDSLEKQLLPHRLWRGVAEAPAANDAAMRLNLLARAEQDLRHSMGHGQPPT